MAGISWETRLPRTALAANEIKIAPANLVMHYDWRLVANGKPEIVDYGYIPPVKRRFTDKVS